MLKKKILATAALSALAALTLTSCRQLDVIGNASVASFDAVLKAIPDDIAVETADKSWVLTAPDGSAHFFWSMDYSVYGNDVQLVVNAKPFLDAGLDVSKLTDGMVKDGQLIVGQDLGNEQFAYSGDATPLASFTMLEKKKREKLKYHADLDHFGVDVGNGNTFEFAKNMSVNDKDIVFVLNPQPLIDAGVDPSKVDGWAYAKIDTMDESGRKIQVDKFLKPFNLK